MADALTAPRRAGDGRIALPGQDGASAAAVLRARLIEPLRVVALRGTGDGIETIGARLSAHGYALPEPGRCSGGDPCVLWRSPTEWLLIATSDALADQVLQELATGRYATACAIEQSPGVVAIELEGGPLEPVLSRLVDASAIPREPGRGTRARLGDVAVTMLRVAEHRMWLIAERSVEGYLVDWITYAAANAASMVRAANAGAT